MQRFAHFLLYGPLYSFQFVLEPLIELLPQILLFRQAQRLRLGRHGPRRPRLRGGYMLIKRFLIF